MTLKMKEGAFFGLERTYKLLRACGNPEKYIQTIQIVGTNGKGSTLAMISSILLDAGITVGTYTSPHLVDFKERIKVNGKKITNINNNILKVSISSFNEYFLIIFSFFKSEVCFENNIFSR